MKKFASFIVLAATLTGCTSTSYTDPTGAKFSRISFLNSQSVGEVSYSDSMKKLSIKGYQSEQTQVVDAAVTAAVKAAIKP